MEDHHSILIQDKPSTIFLESNGRESTRKRSHKLNIKYFFVKDVVQEGKFNIGHCKMEEIVADFTTKPLHGSKFKDFFPRCWVCDSYWRMCVWVVGNDICCELA